MKLLLVLPLVFLIKTATAATDSMPTDLISKPESLLEHPLDKKEIASQKFAELVKSTLHLMSPDEKTKTSEINAEISTP